MMYRLIHRIGKLTIILFFIVIVIDLIFELFTHTNPTKDDMIGVWTCDVDSSSIVFF